MSALTFAEIGFSRTIDIGSIEPKGSLSIRTMIEETLVDLTRLLIGTPSGNFFGFWS